MNSDVEYLALSYRYLMVQRQWPGHLRWYRAAIKNRRPIERVHVRVERARAGTDPIRIHDISPHYLSCHHDRARQLARCAGRAVALDEERRLSRPLSLLVEDPRRQLRHGRRLGAGDGLSVRDQLELLLGICRKHYRPAAITANGGEVLKFIGDAVLVFFAADEDHAANCDAAFIAANTIQARLANVSTPTNELSASIALHHGEVSYGNIGSGLRLDFTVIGPDVNLVGRIQKVCDETGRPVLMSARFAVLLRGNGAQSIGLYRVKGFPEPIELFSPARRCLS
jgi:class 3 adenylate cyclase